MSTLKVKIYYILLASPRDSCTGYRGKLTFLTRAYALYTYGPKYNTIDYMSQKQLAIVLTKGQKYSYNYDKSQV